MFESREAEDVVLFQKHSFGNPWAARVVEIHGDSNARRIPWESHVLPCFVTAGLCQWEIFRILKWR